MINHQNVKKVKNCQNQEHFIFLTFLFLPPTEDFSGKLSQLDKNNVSEIKC
jgi:hypothetical protein